MNKPENTVTILLADDHPVVRSGIRYTIEQKSGYRVVSEAGNGIEALQWIRQSMPDVAIIDIEMPEMDGFAVAETVYHEDLPVRLIIMTMHNDEDTFNKAMDLGINGFVLKENATGDIMDAIVAVMQGKYYLSPSLSDYLIRRSSPHNRDRKTQTSTSNNTIASLTTSELKILRLIADQKTTKSIAAELFISPKTVEKHRSNICNKLDLHGAYALLKFAFENKKII
jgi:DNA-binding NarL/FixJ family response regulator